MRRTLRLGPTAWAAAAAIFLSSGCTGYKEWVDNNFKVGPNYCTPKARVAEHWIDASDIRVRKDSDDLSRWWTVFHDSTLNSLIHDAYHQDLTLKEAGFRVLAARANLAIVAGNLFPQTQTATGGYERVATAVFPSPGVPASTFYSSRWNYGFNLSWELDFWGAFRRAVAQADRQLESSVENYDDALVTLLGDVATNYVLARQYQEEIALTQANVDLQRGVLKIIQARLAAGTVSELDVDQAQATLSQTEAQIPVFRISLREVENHLCTLMGMPPTELEHRLGVASIPTAPPDVAVGIPANLLSRRPDIRSAERAAAAQSEAIGIAKSNFYPHISIAGTLDYSAEQFKDLFKSTAFNGSVGPQFTWNILNYGRIANNVKLQDANFQLAVLTYQQTVLSASEEAENGVVTFLRAHERAKVLTEGVVAAQKAVNIVINQYKVGSVDFNRVATIEQALVQEQDLQAQARGQIGTGLVQVYRALGGGWQLRLGDSKEGEPAALPATPLSVPGLPEELPAPKPVPEDPQQQKPKEKPLPKVEATTQTANPDSDARKDSEATAPKRSLLQIVRDVAM